MSAPRGEQLRVAALAGRRIDEPATRSKRFPLQAVPTVRSALHDLFLSEKLGLLVSSAACGADLLALDVAIQLGIRSRVVLPFNAERFRETSVVDRPGDWGHLYDNVMAVTASAGDLVVLEGENTGDLSYAAANTAIINIALTEAAPSLPLAILVWEGKPRNGSDATSTFRSLARDAGMPLFTVQTCPAQ